jgi:hypothetical protein
MAKKTKILDSDQVLLEVEGPRKVWKSGGHEVMW